MGYLIASFLLIASTAALQSRHVWQPPEHGKPLALLVTVLCAAFAVYVVDAWVHPWRWLLLAVLYGLIHVAYRLSVDIINDMRQPQGAERS